MSSTSEMATWTTSSDRLRMLRAPTTDRLVSFNAALTFQAGRAQRRRDAEHDTGERC
jgi:hypothetical protein